MIKNAKLLTEEEFLILEELYRNYIRDHYLRVTNDSKEHRASMSVLERRWTLYAQEKIEQIKNGNRIVLVNLPYGFVEGAMEGNMARLYHIYVSENVTEEQHLERAISLELFKELVEIFRSLSATTVVARSYNEDMKFNSTLQDLGFEIDEMGASTCTSEKTI